MNIKQRRDVAKKLEKDGPYSPVIVYTEDTSEKFKTRMRVWVHRYKQEQLLKGNGVLYRMLTPNEYLLMLYREDPSLVRAAKMKGAK